MTDQSGGKTSGRSSDLSARLQAVAGLVTDGYRLADIGTDHAYIPIWLVKTGRIPGAVAADINKGPLKRAMEHIRANGLESRIDIRLSDGFSALTPGEVQSAVLAGMGGGLMIRILKEGIRVVECLEECILQPQSEIEKVRAFLLEEGFLFLEENMVREDGKYYPMMKVKPPGSGKDTSGRSLESWTGTELKYGKLLLEGRHPVLRRYLEKEIEIRREILKNLSGNDSERARERAEELNRELACAKKGMNYYVVQ